MAITFGLVVPAGPPKGHIAKWAQDLELLLPEIETYFESLWMTDHLQWEDKPTFEAWTVMSYLATRWPQFKVGPVVLGQSYRNPALLAKMAATLQTLCKGNFIMGIGAGWKEDEYHAYDYPYPRPGVRVAQLEDTLEILTRMWNEPGQVSYQGTHYKVVDAYCEPKPDPVPPILVGGGGQKTMRLAARFGDLWNIPDAGIETYRQKLPILKQHCEDVGRNFDSIRLSWFGRLGVAATQATAEALSDGKWTSANALVGTPQQVVDLVTDFAAIGIDYFMVEVLDFANPNTRRMVLDEVLAKLQNETKR